MINKKIKFLLRGSNLWNLGEGMFGPLFAVFAQRIGNNLLEVSWAWAVYLIAAGMATILVGKMSDGRWSKVHLLVLGNTLNALLTFGYIFVDGPRALLFVQVGLGIAAALAINSWEALYSEYEDKKHDGFEWGLANGEGQIFAGIALVIGGFIVTYVSFTLLFLIMGTMKIIATIQYARLRALVRK